MVKGEIEITDEFITLGQLLKLTNLFDSGGFIKAYLQDVGVLVNGEQENRRGRKLYHHDTVDVNELGSFIVKSKLNDSY